MSNRVQLAQVESRHSRVSTRELAKSLKEEKKERGHVNRLSAMREKEFYYTLSADLLLRCFVRKSVLVRTIVFPIESGEANHINCAV